MTILSLYVYDRHCECVYYQDWNRTKQMRPSTKLLPGVMRSAPALPASIARLSTGGVVVAQQDDPTAPSNAAAAAGGKKGLPFDEESKLVYGVIFSLRNMVKKLAGREEAFLSYRTSTYKVHYFETASGFKFILLSDLSSADSLIFLLRQIYSGPFIEHVVRNPMIGLDSRISGRGIDSDAFREAVNAIVMHSSA